MKENRVKIQLMAVVEGNMPCEQTQYLICHMAHRYILISAYLKGNGYVKIFALHDYIEWEYNKHTSNSIDISQDEFNDDDTFESIIEHNFLSFSKR